MTVACKASHTVSSVNSHATCFTLKRSMTLSTRTIAACIGQLSRSVLSQGSHVVSCKIRCTFSRIQFHHDVVNVEVHVLAVVHEHDVMPDTSGDLQRHDP